MKNIVDDLHFSANLIKNMGSMILPNGKNLNESLKIDGISYWDVFATELARSYIPASLSKKKITNKAYDLFKPYLVRIKYHCRDFFRIFKYRNKSTNAMPLGAFLFLDYTPQQSRDIIQPIIKYVKSKKKQTISIKDCYWSDDNLSENYSDFSEIIWSYWSNELTVKTKKIIKEFKEIYKKYLNSDYLDKVLFAENPYVKKNIKIALNRLFIAEISGLVRQGVVANTILKKIKPSIIIASDINDPRTRILMLLSKNYHIPCLALQNGLVNNGSIEWRFLPADYVAVWGKKSKEILASHGIQSKKIFMTGSPRNDIYLSQKKSNFNKTKKKLGIPKNSKIILLASTFSLPSYNNLNNDTNILKQMKSSIFNSINKFNNLYLIVKPHPSENDKETKLLAPKNPRILFVSKKEDIRSLIMACDCFVSFGSTATIDAILLDKIVICPNFPGWVWSNTYTDTKAVLSATSIKQIDQIFKNISLLKTKFLSSKLKKSRQSLIHEWIYKNDGLGSKRIGDLACEIASNKGKLIS
jgi:hypothetical protein